jgi:hypothetical protein
VRPSGWISRAELPFTLAWAAPTRVGVSGIAGYAVRVDRDPAGDPGSGINHPDADDRTLSLADLPEGSSYAHVVAFSGAGLRGSPVGTAELKTDKTDPAVELEGAPAGWANAPVNVVVRASDALSGMATAVADDGRPTTSVQVDAGSPLSADGSFANATVAGEGVHTLHYWAQDLAGNRATARIGTVRIDLTKPSLAFANSQDPVHPEEIVVPVSDALSGVFSGQIYYRPRGAAGWRALPTQLRDRQSGGLELAAEFPSDRVERGYYEFHADATDRAGNRASTEQRADGSQMVLRTPLKVETALTTRLITPNGSVRGPNANTAIVPYQRGARVTGLLRTVAGTPLAGEPVRILQRPLPGSTIPVRIRMVTTNAGGEFWALLPAGPSRRIEVSYDGSPTLTRSNARPLRMLSRATTSFAISPQRVRNRATVHMRGAVAHPGARIPKRGKLIEIQFLDTRRDRWRPVQVLRTNRSGRFRFDYRFLYIVQRARIAFRAAVLREANFPFAEGASKVVRVTVNP